MFAGVVSQNGAMFQVQTFDADTNQLRTEVARKFGLDVFCERVEPVLRGTSVVNADHVPKSISLSGLR